MKLFIFVMLLTTASLSQAAILVEPLIGYNLSGKLGENNTKGPGFGAHLGYQSQGGFQIGGSYLKSSVTMDDEEVFNEKVNLQELGAFLGYKGDLFKIYFGLILSAEGETEVIDGSEVTFEEGSGSKIGVGFTGLKYLHLNLEYRTGKFDEVKLNGTSFGSDKFSSLFLNVSLPLTL